LCQCQFPIAQRHVRSAHHHISRNHAHHSTRSASPT
jgi:hypothetical protein